MSDGRSISVHIINMSKKATSRESAMTTRKAREREHDFTLVLTGISDVAPEVEDALFEAGCDDATLGVRCGRAYLTFSRAAPTLKDAIFSAIGDVRRANIGCDVLRVDDCSVVTQSDIARRIGRTRQLIRQYVTGERGPGGFPPPACHVSDNSPLWYWCEVAHWLWQHGMIREDTRREAQEVSVINTVLELRCQKQSDAALADEVLNFIGPR
jgi:hypothetical protein